VHPRVVGDGAELRGIDLPVGEDRFFGNDLDDPSDEDLGLLVVAHDLAFRGEGELLEQRGVHLRCFGRVESGLGDLVVHVLA